MPSRLGHMVVSRVHYVTPRLMVDTDHLDFEFELINFVYYAKGIYMADNMILQSAQYQAIC